MLVVNEIIEVITDRNPTFNHYPGNGAYALRYVYMYMEYVLSHSII